MRTSTKLKKTEVAERIFNVTTEGAKRPSTALGYPFMRAQEFYENPKFRGKTGFTIQDLKEWYLTTELGLEHGFNYCFWFDGYNFPGENLDAFYKGKFNPLIDGEKRLFDLFENLWSRGEKFYVIGTKENAKPKDLKHEISHGLYYFSEEYRKESERILKELPEKEKSNFYRYLKSNNYHPALFDEERIAYLTTSSENDLKTMGLKLENVAEVRDSLIQLYDRFFQQRKA